MSRKRKEKATTTRKKSTPRETVFSLVDKLVEELNKPYLSEYGVRFLFEKEGCFHEVIVGERWVNLTSYVGGGSLFLEKDKLDSFYSRIKEQSKRFRIPLKIEIGTTFSTKSIFHVFPRMRFAIGLGDKDQSKRVTMFVSKAHRLFVKVKEIIGDFRVYDKSFETLEKLWEKAKSVMEKNEKGRLLEVLLSLLMEQDENFDVAEKNVRTKSEEIDILIENLGRTGFYLQLRSPLILLECRNWTSKIGAKDIRDFAQKIQNRPKVLCNVGILITTSKLTRDANAELVGYRGKDFLIVVLEGKDIETIIKKKLHIGDFLKAKFREAGLR